LISYITIEQLSILFSKLHPLFDFHQFFKEYPFSGLGVQSRIPYCTLFSWAPESLQMVTAAMKLKKKKKNLLFGRRAMTNLDSVLKSRDVTFLTKVCLVKAMVFPVVMYGCGVGP